MNNPDLRLQLRGLRRDLPPATDLWPGIEARLGAKPGQVPGSAPRRGNHASRFAPWALAASLVLAVGVAWQMQPPPAPVAGASMDREATAMAREYRAALMELQVSSPQLSAARPDQAALRELDQGAREIRDALARNPDSRFLLERLRRTYALRLELTQRELTQRASIS